jgi:glycerophosphoryl diester phosphodiesterase
MRIIGHRGAKGEAPENTLCGFAYAIALGIRTIEFDVRLTKDHQAVIMHDATVDRTTNGSGAIGDLTLADLSHLDARADFPAWPVSCGVPLLADALDLLTPLDIIQVEFKSDQPNRLDRLAQVVRDLIAERRLESQVVFTSFDPVAVEILLHHCPTIRRGYIGPWDTPEFVGTAHRLKCWHAEVFRTATPDLVRNLQAEGFYVVGSPCTPEMAETAIAWGADAVITDHPTEMRAALTSLGGRFD